MRGWGGDFSKFTNCGIGGIIRIRIRMADRAYNDRNIRKITKNGTSHSVSIPVEILKELGWREKQKVVVKKIRGGLQIKDWKK